MIFFCLENQEIAKHRVAERVEFKGHYVDNKTIDLKWKAGYKNLNNYFEVFDNILIVDNSIQKSVFKNLVQIEEGKIVLMTDKLSGYLKHRLPNIYKLIEDQKPTY